MYKVSFLEGLFNFIAWALPKVLMVIGILGVIGGLGLIISCIKDRKAGDLLEGAGVIIVSIIIIQLCLQ